MRAGDEKPSRKEAKTHEFIKKTFFFVLPKEKSITFANTSKNV
jgi:hypothetical protein